MPRFIYNLFTLASLLDWIKTASTDVAYKSVGTLYLLHRLWLGVVRPLFSSRDAPKMALVGLSLLGRLEKDGSTSNYKISFKLNVLITRRTFSCKSHSKYSALNNINLYLFMGNLKKLARRYLSLISWKY